MTPGTRSEPTGATPLDLATRQLRQRRAWITVLVTAQLYLLANGREHLGSSWDTALLVFYLEFMKWPLILDEKLLDELLKSSMAEYLIKFGLGYFVGVGVFFVIFVFALHAPPTKIAYSAVPAMFALQLLVVAPAEELFFRAFLPRMYDPSGIGGKAKMYLGISLTDALVSGSFSIFHYSAYGKDAPLSYVIAFFLSLTWLAMSRREVGAPFNPDGGRRKMGIAFTMGWHAAHNLCAFGVLTGGVVFGQ